MDQGFSLTEVLVSLLLMTTASLALLKHQWQTSQLFNQTYTSMRALSVIDNAAERFYVGYSRLATEQLFKLQYDSTERRSLISRSSLAINIKITWVPQCTMTRQLILELDDE